MTFQKLNPSTLAIKAGTGTLTLSVAGEMKIGDYAIEGPGEYEIAGIGLHVSTTHAIVVSESIQVAVVWEGRADIDGEASSIDILLSLIDSSDAVVKLVKSLDPRVVVLNDESVATAVATSDGIAVESLASYKVTPASLPAETRTAIVLT